MSKIEIINKYFWRKRKQCALLTHSKKLWPRASYYYKLAELAWSQEADNLAWSQNGWLFSHSPLSVIACGCDKRFYCPNFQNHTQIKCMYVWGGGGWWCWGRSAMYCVFRKGYDTLFITLQGFRCCLILCCEADDKLRCPLPGSNFLRWYSRQLAWPKDAQDSCLLGAPEPMAALPWAQYSAENGTAAHPDF